VGEQAVRTGAKHATQVRLSPQSSHIQKEDRAHFITFNTHQKWILPAAARDIVLSSCLFLDGKKIELHAAVVMPEHVHMIFSVLRNQEGYQYAFAEILGPVKGYTAHEINKKIKRHGPVWQDESFDHVCVLMRNWKTVLNICDKTPCGGA
jgi:REP element-mobilizing transposase RayT